MQKQIFLFVCSISFLDFLLFCDLGGRIVIVTRAEHLTAVEEYRDRLEPLMKQLEDQGKWRQLERTIFQGFFLDKEGILLKYEVC